MQMCEQKQFSSECGEVATGTKECSRVMIEVLLLRYLSSVTAHHFIVGPKGKRIEYIELNDGMIVVSIGEIHAIAIADIHLIYIGGHCSYFRIRLVFQSV